LIIDLQILTIYTAPITAVVALLYGTFLLIKVLKQKVKNEEARAISKAIRNGTMAYIKRQFIAIFPLMLSLAAIIAVGLDKYTAYAFIIGAVFSALVTYIGMWAVVKANVRTAINAKKSMKLALSTAFGAGTVGGMLVVGFGLLGVSIIYIWSYFHFLDQGCSVIIDRTTDILIGYGFGAALIALFMRVGGGIFTKAADVGADLVGKVEKNIPEDDPKNPAVIADNVGDNVGDFAGMASDLFESYAVTMVAAMILGGQMFGLKGLIFPLLARSGSVFSSIIGTLFVKVKSENDAPIKVLFRGFLVSSLLVVFLFWFIGAVLLGEPKIAYATIGGVVAMLALLYITKYYTGPNEKTIVHIANSARTGSSTNIITGLAYGMESTFVSVLVVVLTILFGYSVLGFYGIALTSIGMLATTGIIMSMDTFGPISDNAQGISTMAGLGKKANKITADLDAAGNTTKALTKGFAVGSAALAACSLFAAYLEATNLTSINISNPKVFAGVLMGGALPFLFSSRLVGSVGRAAFEVVEEVRKQFKEIPQILKGSAMPNYARIFDIVTAAAQRELVVPAILVITAPLFAGVLGAEALGGFLAGTIVVGLMLAFFMCNTGGAWDNAKKYIEDGNFGGKGSAAHKAAVVGDTVGDPLKDTSGPALNPMMKIVQIVALLTAPFIVILIGM